MRILILTQYYPPESGAPQNRLSDLAQWLKTSGHEVTILTALPNYPKGEIFAEYRGRLVVEESTNGVTILRTWIYATKSKEFARRLLNYLSFVLSSFFVGAWKIGPQDILLVESPPLFLGISGVLLSLFKRAKLVSNISDLWPESAIAMGILRNNMLVRLSRLLEEFLYKKSQLITGQTQGIVDNIRSRFPDKRISLITNGVNVGSFLKACEAENKSDLRQEFGFANNFVVVYAGLHGLAQGLETVVQTAGLLREHENLMFAFFGDGPEKAKVMELAHRTGVRNVQFFPSQPTRRVPGLLAASNLAVIPLRNLPIFRGALPSKMFEAMAARVPLVVSVEGEARRLVETAQAGIAVEPENPRAMADAILTLFNNRKYSEALGLNGQRYVLEHYDRQKIAQRFERLLIDVRYSVPATP